jgi:DNA-binding HxlR family transcriptional regulator
MENAFSGSTSQRYNLARQEYVMKMMLTDCRVKVTVDVIRGKWKPIIIKL